MQRHNNKNVSRKNFLARVWRATDGNVMIIATFGLLLIMGVLALSVDHGQNYMAQANLEARLTAQTKYAGREYTEWWVGQKIKEKGYGKVTDKPKVLLKVNDDLESVKEKLNNYVGNQVFGGAVPANACIGGPRIDGGGADGDTVLEFYVKQAQSSKFALGVKEKKTCDCAAPKAAREKGCILVQSGVTVPPGEYNNPDFLAMSVVSLDMSSKSKIGNNMGDMLKKVENVLKSMHQEDAILWAGVQKGNIPSGVSNGSDNDDPELDITTPSKMGWSGGVYDNSSKLDTPTGKRLTDSSRKYPVLMSLDVQAERLCTNTVWTYQGQVQGQCYEWSYNQGSAGQSCADIFPSGADPAAYRYVTDTTVDDGSGNMVPLCEYQAKNWKPLVRGQFYRSCAKGAVQYGTPPIDNPIATYVAKNTPTGGYKTGGSIPLVTINAESGGGAGGGQGSSEFGPLKAKNTDKSWINACDTRNSSAFGLPPGAFGLPYGDSIYGVGRPALNDDGTPSGSAHNKCTAGDFNTGGAGPTTVGFTFKDAGHGEGNFPEGFYEVTFKAAGGGGAGGMGSAVPPGGKATTMPSPDKDGNGMGWAFNAAKNVTGASDGAECPGGMGNYQSHSNLGDCPECADYVLGNDIVGEIPPRQISIASAQTEFGRTIDGDPQTGLLDSFDYDIENGEIHPEGSPPVANNDDGDGKSNKGYFGSGEEYPFFFHGASKKSLSEYPFLDDGAAKAGILTVGKEGIKFPAGGRGVLGWWPHSIIDCKVKPGETPPNWCYLWMPVVNLNTVKDFTGAVTYADGDFKASNEKVNILQYSIKGAQNMKPALGEVAFQNMMTDLKRGYTGYGIFEGHNGNQCALLKAGLDKALSVKNVKRRGLIFIGSCPPATWGGNASMTFEGHDSDLHWYANGNGSPPGARSEPWLNNLNKPSGGSLRQDTYQCFQDVKSQVDEFLVLTDSSCPTFRALTSDFELGSPSVCEMDDASTQADCIKQIILGMLPQENREARKR